MLLRCIVYNICFIIGAELGLISDFDYIDNFIIIIVIKIFFLKIFIKLIIVTSFFIFSIIV
jgi:hypothetical protein